MAIKQNGIITDYSHILICSDCDKNKRWGQLLVKHLPRMHKVLLKFNPQEHIKLDVAAHACNSRFGEVEAEDPRPP